MPLRIASSNEAVIVGAKRTPIASPHRSLKHLTAVDLAAISIKGVLLNSGLTKKNVEEVIFGNVVSSGTGQNLARQASIKAGLGHRVVASKVDTVCGAGLLAVVQAYKNVVGGFSQCIIAGGSESATHNPFLLKRDELESSQESTLIDSALYDGLRCSITKKRMGDLMEEMVKRHRLARQNQDVYALESHVKACSAIRAKAFKNEIIKIKKHKSKSFVVRDDRPRDKLTLDNFSCLSPAFSSGGTITAGNASALSDGAASVLITSKKLARKQGCRDIVRIKHCVHVGSSPHKPFESMVPAIKTLIQQGGISLDQVDMFEIGESFAAQALWVINKLNLPFDKVNRNGGDVAFGHPLGSAGTRIVVTLYRMLCEERKKYGVACMGYAGGGALAVLLERLK